MHRLTCYLLLVFLLLTSCRKQAKPNFVFLLVDDLGWADLGCYGSTFHETPRLDAFADHALLFSNAYASCPVCSPTRASILTGKYPTRVHITDWIKGDDPKNRKLLGPEDQHQLSLDEYTLAEALRDQGYRTFFAGKWHLGDTGYFPEQQGFEINKGGHHMGHPPGGYYSPYNNPKLTDGPEGEYLTDRLTDESIRFMKSLEEDEPFLVYLAYYTVHTPIQASKRHIDHFQEKKADMGEAGIPKLKDEHSGSTTLNQVNPAYASMIAALDENAGRLFDYLEESGKKENTYIIFTSDNGGLSTLWHNRVSPTSVQPLRAGKGWAYEGGIRVPLLIAGPGLQQGQTDIPVISMDFYPTLLELAGLDLLPEIHRDGISLYPLLTKGAKPERDYLCWHYPHYHGSQWTPGAAIRRGDWKLIEFYDWEETELYNLTEDPGESRNLAGEMPEKVKELRELLHQWQKETEARMPVPNPAYKPE